MKNNELKNIDVLKMAFADKKNFENGMVLDTRNSEFIEDWSLYDSWDELIDEYVDEYLLDGLDEKRKETVFDFLDYDNIKRHLEFDGGYYTIGVDLELNDKWNTLDIIKTYEKTDKNGEYKTICDLRTKEDELER